MTEQERDMAGLMLARVDPAKYWASQRPAAAMIAPFAAGMAEALIADDTEVVDDPDAIPSPVDSDAPASTFGSPIGPSATTRRYRKPDGAR